ncbi:hypothetical protein CRP01_27435 [Flavilitoribacter nigricans DSM 23189 = NBRC 102662]|uniref:DUF6377 domain-containing protein n=1 Tax=Flavilitoribacter nigricans (strain ATCC 23147 / DSM 23189 / NBRC 102662 / NCIMB 1420 / SS-2) TaxID=1122177 RepID=A0A2D0N5I2_FLAN2|nr:hypothetical protein CRP01_27435 [Flavilitoribacter nigricans DSM 23189 = NBRC 102662]
MGLLIGSIGYGQSAVDSLLQELDATLADSKVYAEKKEVRIRELKEQLKAPGVDSMTRYGLYDQLFEAYRLYRFDSAMQFIFTKLEFAEATGRADWILDSKLKLSAVLTSAGMYKESLDHLEAVERELLSGTNLEFYYHTYKLLYESLRDYASDDTYAPYYDLKVRAYQDSLLGTLSPDSDGYLLESGVLLLSNGKLEAAEDIYRDIVNEREVPGTAAYARAAATLAHIYARQGQQGLQKKFRILSAISDIQAAVKENAALTDLAVQLYREGDIPRANRYIEFALADANFYNARQRKVEISEVYPIITGAYQMQIERQKAILGRYLGIIAVISVLLVIALVWIYWQMRRLARARKNLHQANVQLQELNQQLKEANFVKEEYIGHFLNQCSVYIEKLENYQKLVRKNVLAKKMNTLLEMTEPDAISQAELKEFYANFDAAFLRLYPDFVSEFNGLLDKGERVNLKNGELLNTELRIFALIRLGIADSNKIAHFLRYSVNTIYNYRAQIKNKSSIDRDQFEEEVMKIGAIPA